MPLASEQKEEIQSAMKNRLETIGLTTTGNGKVTRIYRFQEWDNHSLQTIRCYLYLHLYCPRNRLKVHLELRANDNFSPTERQEISTYSNLPESVQMFQSLVVFYNQDPNPSDVAGIEWIDSFADKLIKIIGHGLKCIQDGQDSQKQIFTSNRLTARIDDLIPFFNQ